MNLLRILFLVTTASSSLAQDYRDDGNWDQGGGNYYGSYDDSMGDYFDKGAQQPAGGGNHLMKMATGSALGWFLGGKIHSKRAAKSLKQKHSKERAAFVQLYREQVGALQEFNKESARIIQAMESSIIARQNGVGYRNLPKNKAHRHEHREKQRIIGKSGGQKNKQNLPKANGEQHPFGRKSVY